MNDKYYWKMLQMFISYEAGLTQLGECFPYKEEVVGSSPTSCTPRLPNNSLN